MLPAFFYDLVPQEGRGEKASYWCARASWWPNWMHMWLSFLPLWQFNCIFDINWSKGCCECTLGCHIDFRESLFFLLLTTPLLNLSRRAAVNFPHRQGGQLGGTGSLQQVLEFDTPSFLVISFSVARRKSSKPRELSVSIEMTADTAYVTLSISHLSRKRGLNSY